MSNTTSSRLFDLADDCRFGSQEQDDLASAASDVRKLEAIQSDLKARLDAALETLEHLAIAESEYRRAHDALGAGDMVTGRAWDEMRRVGDRARTLLDQEGLRLVRDRRDLILAEKARRS